MFADVNGREHVLGRVLRLRVGHVRERGGAGVGVRRRLAASGGRSIIVTCMVARQTRRLAAVGLTPSRSLSSRGVSYALSDGVSLRCLAGLRSVSDTLRYFGDLCNAHNPEAQEAAGKI